jgi:hypothetical protein
MQEILERAIEGYRRERFLEEVNAAYAALRQNSKEWKEMQAERRQWETTLGDGLEDNRPARPTSGGRGRAIGKKK